MGPPFYCITNSSALTAAGGRIELLNPLETRLRRVLLALMTPIARIILRCGVNTKEATEILKAAFVLGATQDLGRKDTPASVSHVSRVTGLTRQEITRLKEKFGQVPLDTMPELSKIGVVMSHWHTDLDYLDPAGRPRLLETGPGDISFDALVSRCLPDIDPQILLTDMIERGYVERSSSGQLKALRRNVSNSKGIEATVQVLEHGIRCLAHTIHHNIEAKEGETWVQRNVSVEEISRSNVPFARRAIRDRAREFTFGIDDLLAAASKVSPENDEHHDDHKMTIGVGLFYYEMDAESADISKD